MDTLFDKMKKNINVNIQNTIAPLTLSVLFLFFLFRTAIPFFKYPFILLFVIYIPYILISKRSQFSKYSVLNFIRNYKLPLILFLIILFSYFFFTSKSYLFQIKEISNIFILLLLFYISSIIFTNLSRLNQFYNIFTGLIVLFALIISFSNILVFFDLSINPLPFYPDQYNPPKEIGRSNILEIDYNFALLPIFYGFLCILSYLKKNRPIHKVLLCNITLLIYSLNIVISGSKRGIILYLLFVLIILFIQTVNLFNKKKSILSTFFSYYIISIFSISIVIFLFFNLSNIYTKNKLLKLIGTEEVAIVKNNITTKAYRYSTLLNLRMPQDKLYERMWNPIFDSKDPNAGWGVGIFKTIYKLEGNNVNIVPPGSIGYMLDNSSTSDGDSIHAYFSPLIKYLNNEHEDTIIASVYCFVSDNFDGDIVALETDNHACGRNSDLYNLNQKGSWQKLTFISTCNAGIPIYFYIAKGGVSDLLKLKGHVIFAYPEYSVKNPSNPLSTFSRKKISEEHHSVFSQKSPLASYQKYFTASFLESSIMFFLNNQTSSLDNLFHLFIEKKFKSDTTYYPFSLNINLDNAVSNYKEDRILRWKFAWDIYIKEYHWSEKLFGNGFDFLNWYGLVFLRDKTKTDYPHNPFLHILLYSGIFGLLLYIALLYRVSALYWKYHKEYPLFFIFFIITYYFTFFSGGNPFSPPMMGFFMMLPFLTNMIYKNQELIQSKVDENSNNR